MKIRPAKVTDVKTIQSIIAHYAEKKEMLPRSLNDIYENIQEYVVCEDKSKVVGCCALHVSWEDLAEIKALAIAQNYQGKGIGTKLVKTCHKKANDLGIKKALPDLQAPVFFKTRVHTDIQSPAGQDMGRMR